MKVKKTEIAPGKESLGPSAPGCQFGSRGMKEKNGETLYQSNFTMQQHKKKHLAGLKGGTLAGPAGGYDTGNTPMVGADGSGIASHRELQQAKSFNAIGLSPRQHLHGADGIDRPWPKYGDQLRDDVSDYSTAQTPPYPTGPIPEVPWSATQRAHTCRALSRKTKATHGDAESVQSDADLLHSSHAELALRKAMGSTTIRHGQRKAGGATARRSASGSDIGSEKKAFRSHEQLQQAKTVHKFTHDHPRRQRSEPKLVYRAEAPAPRTGQWTPAHL